MIEALVQVWRWRPWYRCGDGGPGTGVGMEALVQVWRWRLWYKCGDVSHTGMMVVGSLDKCDGACAQTW